MNSLKAKDEIAARVRAYAGQLRRNSTHNPPTASPLAHRAVETDYALVSEDALITEATKQCCTGEKP
jgi:hypothetical protein